MMDGSNSGLRKETRVNRVQLEEVQYFRYLSTTISKDVHLRITAAGAVMARVIKVWDSKSASFHIKCRF